MFQRAIVIGCPGAGKSTFARRLRDRTTLPLHYLDILWHKSDRTTVTQAEFDRRLAAVLVGERWIIDGNYLRTLPPRLERCQAVFFLDYPLELCLAGAQARIGKKREDMPWVEECFDPEFRRWILDFPNEQRKPIYALLEEYRTTREIFIFRQRQEAEDFLCTLPRPPLP